jgi:hypothetical protein
VENVSLVPNIPPEEFTPSRASETPPVPSAIAAIRRALGFKKIPAAPQQISAPAPPPAAANPATAEYLPEEELGPGVFHSRRKPKFKAP